MSKIIVCHCEDITLDEVYSALRQGYGEIESLKRYTGIGTGKCQGKCCVIQTLRVLASDAGRNAVLAGREEGPGEPLAPYSGADLDALIRLPTIRQPVLPARICDLVDMDASAEVAADEEGGER